MSVHHTIFYPWKWVPADSTETDQRITSAQLLSYLTNPLGTGQAVFSSAIAAFGDVSGPASSVDSEVALFSGTGGKTLKRASATGIAKLTSGVLSALTLGANVETFLATPSSANLIAAVTDETGSGALVFGTSPTITTAATCPLVIGGTGTTATLILRSTSGVGAAGADIVFQVGNNGATEAMRILNSGNVGIGTTPSNRLHIYTAVTADGLSIDGNSFPAIVMRSSGTIKGYAPAVVTAATGFFSDSATGDIAFRSEANSILFGQGSGASTLRVVGANVGIGIAPLRLLHVGGRHQLGGTAIATTDWALTSGWGVNASISAVTGTDSRGTVTVQTSVLDTPTLNPVITLTFKDGTWITAPFSMTCMNNGSTGLLGASSSRATATTLILTYDGTPTALSASTYIFNYTVVG